MNVGATCTVPGLRLGDKPYRSQIQQWPGEIGVSRRNRKPMVTFANLDGTHGCSFESLPTRG